MSVVVPLHTNAKVPSPRAGAVRPPLGADRRLNDRGVLQIRVRFLLRVAHLVHLPVRVPAGVRDSSDRGVTIDDGTARRRGVDARDFRMPRPTQVYAKERQQELDRLKSQVTQLRREKGDLEAQCRNLNVLIATAAEQHR